MTTIEDLQALQIAKALSDPVRFAIYRRIAEMSEMRCGDICLDIPVGASTVSHHLKVLSAACLIESRREGQAVYYRSIPQTLAAFLRYLRRLKTRKVERGTHRSPATSAQ
jgi:ArsR family transcriptional regulator, arsenate/arsenite/antimonite-responsive transcriptional repressor